MLGLVHPRLRSLTHQSQLADGDADKVSSVSSGCGGQPAELKAPQQAPLCSLALNQTHLKGLVEFSRVLDESGGVISLIVYGRGNTPDLISSDEVMPQRGK